MDRASTLLGRIFGVTFDPDATGEDIDRLLLGRLRPGLDVEGMTADYCRGTVDPRRS